MKPSFVDFLNQTSLLPVVDAIPEVANEVFAKGYEHKTGAQSWEPVEEQTEILRYASGAERGTERVLTRASLECPGK